MNHLSDEIVNPFSSEIEYTSIVGHAGLIIRKKWRQFFIAGIAVFGVVWTFVESSNFFLNIDLSGVYFYSVLGLISLISATAHATLSYLNTSPVEIENLPKKIQRIAIFKKPFWEYRFTHALLKEKLSKIDERLSGVLNGQVYIEITRKPKIQDYLEWIQLRPTNLLNMVDIAKHLLVYELPSAIAKTKDSEISIEKLIGCIERIKDVYQQTCDYEINGRRIEPPDGLKKIHNLQNGWSKVIRDGIVQILKFLEDVSNLDRKKLKKPIEFTIIFNEAEGIKEFEFEMQKLDKSLPGLLLKEMFYRDRDAHH